MITESFLRKLDIDYATEILQERQSFVVKAKRVLPLIDKKKIQFPKWKATCPKSGCKLTLDIIKEELRDWLEEAEREIMQLEKRINELRFPKHKSSKEICKQSTMELGI